MIAARCPWYIAGPLIGLLIVSLRAAINRPLGALGGYIDIVDRLSGSPRLGLSALVLMGIVAGSAVYAVITGQFSLIWSYGDAGPAWTTSPAAQLLALVLGGAAMGLGARTAGGCTSGHGLTGMSLASPASVVSTMTFFATAVVLANLVAWIFGGRL